MIFWYSYFIGYIFFSFIIDFLSWDVTWGQNRINVHIRTVFAFFLVPTFCLILFLTSSHCHLGWTCSCVKKPRPWLLQWISPRTSSRAIAPREEIHMFLRDGEIQISSVSTTTRRQTDYRITFVSKALRSFAAEGRLPSSTLEFWHQPIFHAGSWHLDILLESQNWLI